MKLPVIANIAIGVVTGLAVHQTKKPIISIFGALDIGYLARCTVGVLSGMLLFSHINRQRKEHSADNSLIDLILAYCSFGLGVLAGYVVDTMRGKR